MADIVVSVDHLVKKFPITPIKKIGVRQLWEFRKNPKSFVALRDVSIDVYKGEVIGLIGLNGSGKTTLSRIIAGISYPTRGSVTVNGSVSMLSTRSGLNSKLTGRENIFYKCLLLGFSYKYIKSIENSIIEFAELEDFIDQPMDHYSSGMQARLGFSISIHINPDILIIDEALAVGDSSFMEKCYNWIAEYQRNGNSIIYVSHSIAQVEAICNRVLWLHSGNVVGYKPTQEIIEPYNQFIRKYTKMSKEEKRRCHPSLE